MAQVSYGTITITDTNDIESIYMEYAQSTSNQTAPTSGWDTDIPTWRQGYYIWQRTVTKMSGVPLSSDSYGEPICLTGSTGSTGATGRGVSSIVTTYCNYGTGEPAASYSGWQSTVPTYDSTKPNYWVKTVITYTTGTPATDTTIYKDNGITNATSTAAAANLTAQAASDKADDAWNKADNAETIAGNANSAISDLNQYFWRKKTASTNVPAGSYVTNIPGTTYESNPTQGGFNSLVQATGIFLRNGITTLSSWTGTALTFNNPSSGNAQLIIGANGTLQSGNYTRGSDSKFSSNGTKIDLINGDIITKYFRVSQGLETGLSAGVYVHGTIEALDGTIGTDSTNYWEIGNGTDYNLSSTAKMIGHGSSYIQLGDSSTWRLATNRVHTGWYITSDSLLHYPEINSKYWDFGLHTPATATEKFLYIRKSKANTSASNVLTNLLYDIDDTYTTPQWDYIFYVSADGSLYARNLYVLDENGNATQIGGTDGVYLLKSGGTMTGSITMSNGGKFIGDVTGNVSGSASKLSNTSIIGNMNKPVYFTANGVPAAISYEINKSVPSNAIFTDENVNTSQANTTKIYLTGTSTAGSSTGKLNFDSNVYLTTTAGTLHATTFEGNLSGTASRAIADGDGNTIKTTYLKLSGGNVTGAVSFGSSVSVDELTVGDLIVNGAGRFTNGLYGDLTGNVTGSITGNAATADKVNHNLVIKLASGTTEGTNMFTFNGSAAKTVDITKSVLGLGNVENKSSATIRGELTSANVTTALGFTPYNSTNPNGYTANTGTVTSVAASGSGGITISGSPITTSGTITVGLNLSTAINGLGEGTSNANREDYVVVQYAGGGTTNTTYYRRKLKLLFAALNSSDITTALGYTPYNSTNPNGYTSNTGTVTSVRVQATSPVVSSTSTASSTTLDTTISLANGYGDTKNPYGTKTANYVLAGPSSGNAAAPTFRALVAADIPTITKSKISDFPASLKNPNALKVRVYSGTSTPADTSYDGSTANQSVEVAGKGAITGVSAAPKSASSDVTTFTLTKADGTTSTFDIAIVASEATGATTLRDSSGPINKGSATKPVYFSSGVPVEANTYAGGTAVTLNGSSKASSTASFYAPTGAGTSGQVLTSSGGTPGWTNQSSLSVGSATTATKFSSNRTVALTGDVTGSVSGDGSSGWSVATTVQDDSHNHTLATILPLKSKTFTDVIGTANNWADATFFFGSIKPDTWNEYWRIKYKIRVYVPGQPNYNQIADVMISGRAGDFKAYYSLNTIGAYYVCYYHELYRLKEAGFNAGYGHSTGVRFYSAYNPTDTNYKRTIEVEILETENCSFDFYDNCLKYAEIPGTGTTNYNTYTEMDFVTNGLQETGDANDVNYYNRSYYGSRTTKNALYRYQFCVTDSTGQVIPINSVNNSVATNKTLMIDSFDPFGEIFQWVSTSTYAAGANVGNGNWYRQYLADLRYSFNCGGYDVDSTLTARLPLYLVVVPQGDGTVKLHSEPLSQTLPTSDDGLLYIYLGRVYEDAKPYRVVLTFNHPIYWYKDGAVRQYTHMAARALADESGNTISSTYVKKAGDIMTGNLGIKMGDTDKHIIFDYDGDGSAGGSWRIAALGTGSNDTNYFAIQSGTSTTTATAWNNVIRLGQNTYDAAFGGNVYPLANNSKTLGTSSLKWSNVYATTFTGALSGNATTANTFSSNASITLTGDTTGTASSTKGWSITTKTDRISTVGDNRAVATTPNDYANKIIFQGLKTNSSFGAPSTEAYSYVIGLRGWADSSGGKAHEFAFNDSGINHRSGATTSWGAWEKLVTSANYSDYTVTKTGSGASGTWGISISGNAATATTASKLGSSNVGAADRPIYLSAGTATQTTYRMAGTNASATTALGIDTNLDSGIWYVNGTSGIYSQSDGAAIVNKYSDSWITQIYQDYRTGQIALRGKNNGTWQAWRKVLDSSNYTSYMGNYVTIAGDNETITGTKSFNNILGTKYVATKSGFGCEINYNSTLDALVFSFA